MVASVCACVCDTARVSVGACGYGSSNSGNRNLSAGNEIIGTNGYTCGLSCAHTRTHTFSTMSADNSLVKQPDAPFPLVVATNEVAQWLNMDRL